MNGTFIFASITAESKCLRKQPATSVADESGNSIGGGLRIKSIKNYSGDSNDRFLGGTEYKYQGGKLLLPTAYAQLMNVVEFLGDETRHSSFYFSGSSPTFPTICSLGSPTVGYSTVIKREIDPNGNLAKETCTQYHNVGYSLVDAFRMFYHSNYGLNGKPKETTVYSSDSIPFSNIRYVYGSKAGRMVQFPWVQDLFMDLHVNDIAFLVSDYRKVNVWNYLSRKTETQYVDGRPMEPIVTTYSYNNENYRPKQMLMSQQGAETFKNQYFYATDSLSAGANYLIDKHCVGRLTGTRSYLNDHLTGGAQMDFTQKDSFPVVSRFYSILPNDLLRLELDVVQHDEHGNIREYVTKDGTHITILWSYSYQYPVMQVTNATYDQVVGASSAVAGLGARQTLSASELRTLHQAVKNALPNALVTAYVYDQWYGVSDIINPIGKLTHYGKDNQGRLSEIRKDGQSGPMLQRFLYNYRNGQ